VPLVPRAVATATMMEPDWIAEPLFDEPNVAVAESESRWAKRRNLTLADLIGEPWVSTVDRLYLSSSYIFDLSSLSGVR
jgi:DNA-binding transcriptional LysR family regulator